MLKKYLFPILSLVYFDLFGIVHFPFILTVLALLITTGLQLNKIRRFRMEFVIFLIGMIANMIVCNYFRHQSYIQTLTSSASIFSIYFFFLIRWFKIGINKIKIGIFILCVIYCFVYYLQYLLSSKGILFISGQEQFVSEAYARLRTPGSALSSLGVLYGLNYYVSTKKKSYLFLLSFCMGIILLMGFRTMFLAILVSAFLLIFEISPSKKQVMRTIIVGCVFFTALSSLPFFRNQISGMLLRQEETSTTATKDMIRYRTIMYFEHEHFHNKIERFFGSGYPAKGTLYHSEMEDLKQNAVHFADLGIYGYSWIYGTIPMLIIMLLAFKLVYIKLPNEYKYVRYWSLFMLLTCVTTGEFFRLGNIALFSTVVYLTYIVKEEIERGQLCIRKEIQIRS